MAWGYVDQPPLIALIARFELLFGDSLRVIRFLPAVAAASMVALTGRLAERLGGGLLAQSVAMLGIMLAPFYLAVGNLLTMNAFEPLIWLSTACLILDADEAARPSRRTWIALGLMSGLGLVNKYSMFFFLGSSVVAIAVTPSRKLLRERGFYGAMAIALAIVSPTLVWQAAHGWPQLQVLHNAAAGVNVVAGPVSFFLQQVLMMSPLTAPIWIAGLAALFMGDTRLRWYGYAYVVISIAYLCLGAKVYYLAPIYPVLFAAGAPAVGAWLGRVRWAAVAYPVLLLVGGLAIAPEAFPLLPLPLFLRYEHVLDFRGIKMERHPEGLVPQHFADELGWNTLLRTFARVDAKLTPAQRAHVAILTRDYGQASAIDVLGPKFGLPLAISGHNNYFLYGPRGVSGDVLLSIGLSAAFMRTEYRSVVRVGTYSDPYVLPDFDDLPIYLCTEPIEPIARWWPATKNYV